MNFTNLPNLITLSRILLIPFFINFIIYNYNLYALLVFIIAGISDALDGFIARTSKRKTRLGTILDPLADKLLISASYITLTITNRIPIWVCIIIISRDIIIIIGALMLILFQDKLTIPPSLISKATTLCQIFYILLILLFLVLEKDTNALLPLLWTMIVLTIASGIHYSYLWLRLLSSEARSN